ncbi:hypothetical protein SLS62_004742 [Diatrype stigma]|uniref:Uncharacterized protein n=1 Tax=Diatrype stigma TaxID=117547 RepID=A0AAN9USM7_9PEZI
MSISLTHTKTTTPAVSTAAAAAATAVEASSPSCPSEQQQQHAESVTITWTIRQDPLVVTLDGRAIFFLATSLILGVHVLPAVAVAALAGAVPLLLFVHNDYHNYLKLGPGGTPPTPAGYLRINWYKLWQLRTPFAPLPPPGPGAAVEPAAGLFSPLHHRNHHKEGPLPPRAGPRPTVVGIAPQRQTDQFGSRACYVALRRALARHAARHADDLAVGTSCFEKHGLGLFARRPVNHTCRGEVCHVHGKY